MWGICILLLLPFVQRTYCKNSDICPEDGVTYPDGSDCRSYFKCENKVPVKHTCPSGLAWHCVNKQCEEKIYTSCCKNDHNPPENSVSCTKNGVKVPDPFSCRNYLQCAGFRIRERSCPSHKQFDWLKLKCEKDEEATCVPNIDDTTQATTVGTAPPANELCVVDGLKYPNPNDCSGYFECVNGQLVKTKCGIGKTYNCRIEDCEFELIPHCCSSTSTTSTKKPCSPTGTPDETSSGQDVTNSGKICNKDGVRYSNIYDCNTYYECRNGKPVLKTCLLNMKWNCWLQTCSPMPGTHCCRNNNNTDDGSKTFCLVEGTKTADPFNCQNFYECTNWLTIKNTCPPGQNFDIWSLQCKDIKSATCAESYAPVTPAYPPETQSPFCPHDDITIPSISDCRSYFRCRGGNLVKQTCPSGLAWNCITQSCSASYFSPCCRSDPHKPEGETNGCIIPGVKIPNPFTCDEYYECIGLRIVEKTCPSGQTYDWLRFKCVNATHGNCAPHTTDNTIATGGTTPNTLCPQDDLRYPSPDDCSGYFQCINGQLIKQKCPAMQNYNCREEKCEHQEIPHCCSGTPSTGSITSSNGIGEYSTGPTTSPTGTGTGPANHPSESPSGVTGEQGPGGPTPAGGTGTGPANHPSGSPSSVTGEQGPGGSTPAGGTGTGPANHPSESPSSVTGEQGPGGPTTAGGTGTGPANHPSGSPSSVTGEQGPGGPTPAGGTGTGPANHPSESPSSVTGEQGPGGPTPAGGTGTGPANHPSGSPSSVTGEQGPGGPTPAGGTGTGPANHPSGSPNGVTGEQEPGGPTPAGGTGTGPANHPSGSPSSVTGEQGPGGPTPAGGTGTGPANHPSESPSSVTGEQGPGGPTPAAGTGTGAGSQSGGTSSGVTGEQGPGGSTPAAGTGTGAGSQSGGTSSGVTGEQGPGGSTPAAGTGTGAGSQSGGTSSGVTGEQGPGGPTLPTSDGTNSNVTSRNPLCSVDGLKYPSADDCSGYFVCYNGQLEKMECPAGETYNCKNQTCEFQIVPHCCSATIPTSTENLTSAVITTTTGTPTISISATSSSETVHDHTTDKPVTATHTTSTLKHTTNILCPEDGLRYPSVDDCGGYFECQNGNTVKQECNPGDTYNCRIKGCEYQKEPHCCGKPASS